jgi:hypothetical protein
MFFNALTIYSGPTKKVLPIHPNDKNKITSRKRKNKRSPNDFLANYVAKKDKTITRRGSQQKNIVVPVLKLANLHSKQVQHFPIPSEVS